MQTNGRIKPAEGRYGLEHHGIENVARIYWNATTPVLYEEIVRRREGLIAHRGPVVVRTGHYTGRSPNDKFIVQQAPSEDKIWWGSVNTAMKPEKFKLLFLRLLAYLQGREIFVQDCYVGADPEHRVPIRVVTENAWHSLFARNMFIQVREQEALADHVPEYTIISAPHFHAQPDVEGTQTEVFIVLNLEERLILIGGTSYAGEIKKSVFTLLNYLYPQKGILSIHSSANVGDEGDVALFFGLSATGKTTLSADSDRHLIGDDEIGWDDKGVFNFEAGCYAKVIRLSEEAEPQIYACTRKFGTILENVAIDAETRQVEFSDARLTENTRASYPINCIENAILLGTAGHPKNIVMLALDAFGILPPISKLTSEQAMYHFLTGYTAKVAGTERGMGKEPQTTFSPCFGAPFLPLPPAVYAKLLGEKIKRHRINCWLVNTGWTGGGFDVGQRILISHTRAMIREALNGALDDVPTSEDPIFRVQVPISCSDVPERILNPRNTWREGREYDTAALKLAVKFEKNFRKFEDQVPPEVKAAGPRLK
jgi:phosphoenolpyruvate carboxykinase (ATP)